jgi:ATP-binding cassette subfamily C protein
MEGTVGENMWGRQGGQALDRMDFSAHIEKDGGNLSSGQKKQLQLFRSLMAEAEVLIFDEPFNFVDSEAKSDIWDEMLRTFAGRTLIVISHDPFPAKDCDRVIDMGKKQ